MMCSARVLLAVVLVAGVACLAMATDFYVSPTGSDGNDGLSEATPFKEIQTGLNQLQAGDTLYLMPGLHIPEEFYTSYKRLRFLADGAPGNPITVTTTGPGVVIDLRNVTPGWWGFSTNYHNYVVVDGGGEPNIWDTSSFNLKICNVPGFENTTFCFDFRLSHDAILRNVWCDEAEQSALFVSNSYDCLVDTVVASNDGQNVNSHGIYIAGGHDMHFRKFRSYGWGKHSIQINGDNQYGHTFDQCVLHDSKGNAFKNFSCRDAVLTNCFLYSSTGFSENVELVRIERNVGYNIPTSFINCTFYSNDPLSRPLAFTLLSSAGDVATLQNCVFYTARDIIGPGTVVADSNLFAGGITPFGTNAYTGDPGFVDPDLGDLHIQFGSPAADRANPLYAPVIDIDDQDRTLTAPPDLGADELAAPAPTLLQSDPATNSTLSKQKNNVIRLTFDDEIALPAGPALVIQPVAGGAELGGAFTYSVEPDGVTLKAAEAGAVLSPATWYWIRPAAALDVQPFAVDLYTLVGDADGNGRVMAVDLGVIWGHNGESTDARYDINGDGRVMAVDLGVTWGHNGQTAPPNPRDGVAPANIADLVASPGSTAGQLVLSWTAPGDDSDAGTAAEYDVRWSVAAITEANWGLASSIEGEPTPAAAGSTEQFIVDGLPLGTPVHVAIKTSDEGGNASGLSNAPSATTPASGDLVLQNGLGAYTACTDATVTFADPVGTYGQTDDLEVAALSGSSETARTIIRFDLSGVPTTATIGSATLMLYTYDQAGPDGVYELRQVTEDWVETDVSWLMRSSVQLWAIVGGTAIPSAVATTPKPPVAGVWVAWDVTSLVQGWIADPVSNHGGVVRAASESGGSINRFRSSEWSIIDERPKLMIDSVVP